MENNAKSIDYSKCFMVEKSLRTKISLLEGEAHPGPNQFISTMIKYIPGKSQFKGIPTCEVLQLINLLHLAVHLNKQTNKLHLLQMEPLFEILIWKITENDKTHDFLVKRGWKNDRKFCEISK